MALIKKKKKGVITKLCSGCKIIKENEKSKYCRKCKALYMRRWRKLNPLTKEQRFKNTVRSKTRMRIKRGLLIEFPCEICGEKRVEAHHDDYNKPYCVRWLCLAHHREHHIQQDKNKRLIASTGK